MIISGEHIVHVSADPAPIQASAAAGVSRASQILPAVPLAIIFADPIMAGCGGGVVEVTGDGSSPSCAVSRVCGGDGSCPAGAGAGGLGCPSSGDGGTSCCVSANCGGQRLSGGGGQRLSGGGGGPRCPASAVELLGRLLLVLPA
jgi:hypothetical protein